MPRGAVPNFHGFRHTAASEAIAAGDGAEEVSWQLGHRNSNVTRAIYVQEIKSAERRARPRARMEDRYGALISGSTTGSTEAQQTTAAAKGDGAEVLPLRAVDATAQ